MTAQEAAVAQVLRDALAANKDRHEALDDAFQRYENANVVSKLAVARYICKECGRPLATVIDAAGTLLVRTKDYRLAPSTNERESVASARASRTLDGSKHWPGATFDVRDLASMPQQVGVRLTCRHTRAFLTGAELLAACEGKRPGHPGPPTRL